MRRRISFRIGPYEFNEQYISFCGWKMYQNCFSLLKFQVSIRFCQPVLEIAPGTESDQLFYSPSFPPGAELVTCGNQSSLLFAPFQSEPYSTSTCSLLTLSFPLFHPMVAFFLLGHSGNITLTQEYTSPMHRLIHCNYLADKF